MAKLSESDYDEVLREIEAACDHLQGLQSKRAHAARGRGHLTMSVLKIAVDSHGLDSLPDQELQRWAESLRYQAEQLGVLWSDRSGWAARSMRRAADLLENAAHPETK